jgi:hypothetical protein
MVICELMTGTTRHTNAPLHDFKPYITVSPSLNDIPFSRYTLQSATGMVKNIIAYSCDRVNCALISVIETNLMANIYGVITCVK